MKQSIAEIFYSVKLPIITIKSWKSFIAEFSIQFKSGDFSGHGMSIIPSIAKKLCEVRAECVGALSCWKGLGRTCQ